MELNIPGKFVSFETPFVNLNFSLLQAGYVSAGPAPIFHHAIDGAESLTTLISLKSEKIV